MTLRIFLSHSHSDNNWCDAFVSEMRRYQVDVWYDREGLYVGDQWIKKIEEELTDRDNFVAIITPASWASKWVQREIRLALALEKHIISVMHKPTKTTGFINTFQMINARGQSSLDTARIVIYSLRSTTSSSTNLITNKNIITPTPQLQRSQQISGQISDISGYWTSPKWKLSIRQSGNILSGDASKIGLFLSEHQYSLSGNVKILDRVDRVNLILGSLTNGKQVKVSMRLELRKGLLKGDWRQDFQGKSSITLQRITPPISGDHS